MANREFYKVLALILFTWAFAMSIRAEGLPIRFDSFADEDLFFTVLAGATLESDFFELATDQDEIYILSTYLEDTIDGTQYKYYSVTTHIVVPGQMIPVSTLIGYFTIGKEKECVDKLGQQFIDGLSKQVMRVAEQLNRPKPQYKKQS